MHGTILRLQRHNLKYITQFVRALFCAELSWMPCLTTPVFHQQCFDFCVAIYCDCSGIRLTSFWTMWKCWLKCETYANYILQCINNLFGMLLLDFANTSYRSVDWKRDHTIRWSIVLFWFIPVFVCRRKNKIGEVQVIKKISWRQRDYAEGCQWHWKHVIKLISINFEC